MFDDLLRQIKRLERPQTISVGVPLDDDRYYDRRCPAPECGSAFKVQFDDWRDKVPDARAWCATCGEVANPSTFNTPEQDRYFRQAAVAHLSGQLDDALRRARKPTIAAGIVTMTWSYKPGSRPLVVPTTAAPAMTMKTACEACGCRFASVGAAFFCPACGHNSAGSTFSSALAAVRSSLEVAERLPTILEDRDAAADAARNIVENSLGRVWASYQRLAEATYAGHPASSSAPAPKNAFQRISDGSALWEAAAGRGYERLLDGGEMRDLVRLVQARHVLAHQDGIVDADYVARSGDMRYAVGQRLVVTVGDVSRLADLAEALARGIRAPSAE